MLSKNDGMKIKFDKVYDDGGTHIATIRYGKLRLTRRVSADIEKKLNLIAKKLGLKLVKNETNIR